MDRTAEHACPVCSGPTALYDVVDFNKNCMETQGLFLPLCGVPIYYRRCAACAFTWAPEFRDWGDADFLNHIYITRITKRSTPSTWASAPATTRPWWTGCSASRTAGSVTWTMAAATVP